MPEFSSSAPSTAVPRAEKSLPRAGVHVEQTGGTTIVRAIGPWGEILWIDNEGRRVMKRRRLDTDARRLALLRGADGAARAMIAQNGSYVRIDGERVNLKKGGTGEFVKRGGEWRQSPKQRKEER